MHTAGSVTCDTAYADGQIFVGADKFQVTGGTGVLTYGGAGSGLLYRAVAATSVSVFAATFDEMFRTGVYATAANGYQQYGTSSGPGPNAAIPNSSGPSGLFGHPPTSSSSANLATLHGPVKGAPSKGIQINWMDLIYSVAGAALTGISGSASYTKFTNGSAVTTSAFIPATGNGLTLAVAANPYRIRINSPTPGFMTTDGVQTILNTNITTAAGGTCNFYGAVVGVTYNFN
jgi:hypothetical protein